MPSHPLTDVEIQKYYKNELKFNDVQSRNNLPIIKDGAYAINIDEFKSIGTHQIALYVNDNNIIYFGSFGVEYIPKQIKKFIVSYKKIYHNKYFNAIQAYNQIMCGYFCIGFIDLMLKDKNLLDYTDLFSHNKYEKNDKVILKYFQ